MKLFTGWVLSVGLVFAGTAANAQVLAPYSLASDFDGPYAEVGGRYAAVVQEAPGPAYGPRLLPAGPSWRCGAASATAGPTRRTPSNGVPLAAERCCGKKSSALMYSAALIRN